MRIAVTGGAGFIGSHVVFRLLNDGYNVTVIDNMSSPATALDALGRSGADIIQLDVLDAEALEESLREVDVVVHLAALIEVSESEEKPLLYGRVNVLGTVSVLEAARRAGVGHIVYASSAAVYGNPLELPLKENHRRLPLSIYGLTKLMGEEACRHYSTKGLDCTVLRFFNVYGELGRRNVVYAFVKAAVEGGRLRVYGDGRQTRDFVYVGDVAVAVEAVIRQRPSGFTVFNVASGREVSVNGLIEIISSLTSRDLDVEYLPPRPGEIRRSFADIERAARFLKWRPRVSLEEGVRRVYKWVRRGEPSLW